MSRRIRQQSGDSLDLLLDTMCNLFGGIVFIALLVAMLAGDGARQRVESPRSDTEEVLRRQIEQLTQEKENIFRKLVEKREDLAQALEKNSPEKLGELASLKARQEALQTELEKAGEEASLSPDARSIQEKLGKELDRQKKAALSLDNELKAFDREILRLKERGRDLAAKARELSEQRIQAVRLPRETQDHRRSNAYMIVRHGKVYPVYSISSGVLYSSHVQTEIESAGLLGEDTLVTPREGAGLIMEEDLAREFRGIDSKEYFPFFLVYPDSFTEFLAARRVAQEAGLDYGLDFYEGGRKVILSARGKKGGTQ